MNCSAPNRSTRAKLQSTLHQPTVILVLYQCNCHPCTSTTSTMAVKLRAALTAIPKVDSIEVFRCAAHTVFPLLAVNVTASFFHVIISMRPTRATSSYPIRFMRTITDACRWKSFTMLYPTRQRLHSKKAQIPVWEPAGGRSVTAIRDDRKTQWRMRHSCCRTWQSMMWAKERDQK